MIELAIAPLDRVVALFAVRRKSRVGNRTLGIVEIVLVARNAGRVADAVVVVDVAVDASTRWDGVRPRQVKASL